MTSIPNYRPDIDGLRGLAVAAVVFYHAELGPFPGGFVGVDVFFVISGYLITSLIIRTMDAGTFSFTEFFERRARRILPVLFLVITVTSLAALLILSPAQLGNYGQSVVAALAFLSNVHFYLTTGYFDTRVEYLPLIHIWSLAIEEQYYLVFPAFLVLFRKINRNILLGTAFCVSFFLCMGAEESYRAASFYLTPFRAWELMAGALLANNMDAWPQRLRSPGKINDGLAFTGLGLIFYSVVAFDKQTLFPGWATIVPVFGTSLVILCAAAPSRLGRALSAKPLVGLGLLSYGIYLWHQPIFALFRNRMDSEPSIAAYLVLTGLAVLLAFLSWRFLERPVRNKRLLPGHRFTVCSIAVFIVLVASGAALYTTRGVPARFDRATLRLAATMTPSPMRDACHTIGTDYKKPQDACRFPGKTSRWAVFGDSHVIELGFSMSELLLDKDEGILQLSFSSCPPALLFDAKTPGCTNWIKEAVEYLKNDGEVTNILLNFHHGYYLYGDARTTYPVLPNTHRGFLPDQDPVMARDVYFKSFAALVSGLVKSGKTVFIAEPTPELPVHVERYVFGNTLGSGTTRAWYLARNRKILSEIRRLAMNPNVHVVRTSASLCSAAHCMSILDGEALYFDDNHLSVAGARRVIAEQMATHLVGDR